VIALSTFLRDLLQGRERKKASTGGIYVGQQQIVAVSDGAPPPEPYKPQPDKATKIALAMDYDNLHAPGQLSRNETIELESLLDKLKSGRGLTDEERDRLEFLCRRQPVGGLTL